MSMPALYITKDEAWDNAAARQSFAHTAKQSKGKARKYVAYGHRYGADGWYFAGAVFYFYRYDGDTMSAFDIAKSFDQGGPNRWSLEVSSVKEVEHAYA